MNPILYSSQSDEWQTPKEVFNFLDSRFNFSLDAAASDLNYQCQHYYTEVDNALTKEWCGKVFLNPPYSKGKQYSFLEKAVQEILYNPECQSIVALVPARTDTRVWHDLIFKHACEIWFIKGRLKFANPTEPHRPSNSATFPSCVAVFKPQVYTRDFYTWEIGTPPKHI